MGARTHNGGREVVQEVPQVLYTGEATHTEDRWPPIAVRPEDAIAMVGIHHAQNLILLITPGWLDSNNCQEEAKTFMGLRKDTDNHAGKQIIPVNFPGITMKDYHNPQKCLFNLQTIQRISQTSDTWMDDVRRAIVTPGREASRE